MNPTEEIAARLVGGAQAAYVRELSYFFLHLFDEVVRTNGAVLKGQEIADFDRLARISREEALGIYYKYRPYIEKQTRETLKRSLKATDDILIGQFIRVLGKRRHMTNLATLIGSQTAQGMYEVINRQNIALAEQQEALWYEVTAEAIARHQAGEPTKAVMERGVSKLANSGLETIDYISGTKTTIDAALRRHIVSQANQARNRLLMQRMDEWEWDLVFVDAHFGARPTHALWQGKVYSRSGRSTEYPPLVESTGYGTVTGLCGANCAHNIVPYVPGLSQLPDTDFADQEKLVGMTSDEYYAATQKQRRYERYIRSKKREIVSLQEAGLDATKQRLQLGTAQDKLRQWVADNHLRRDYQRERAWAVDRQPRALTVRRSYIASAITTGEEFVNNNWLFSQEYAVLADKEGNVVSEVFKGEKRNVLITLPDGYEWEDLQVFHTHPFKFGGTFSVGKDTSGDIRHVTAENLIGDTAVCNEGAYYIRRTESSRPKAFYKAAREAELSIDEEASDLITNKLIDKGITLYNGQITYSDYYELIRIKKAEMMHEWFSKNAKIYGYEYWFEPSGRV